MTTTKAALVTGASRGIGRACALALGKAGYRVGVHYRSKDEEALAVVNEIPGAVALKFDLSESGACVELVKQAKERLGSIDVLVNNAGVSIDQILAFAKEDDFDTLLRTNLKPVFLITKAASKVMIRQRAGRIINLSSVVGHTGNAGQSMYAATKSAITGFTKSVALELAPYGILANCIAPGFILTDMTASLPENVKEAILNRIPLKRLGTPEDIASTVAFLASDQATYITGTTIHVNGGMYTGG